MHQKILLNAKELNHMLRGISGYNTTTGEFLLPIFNTKKTPLNFLKKLREEHSQRDAAGRIR